MTSIGKTLHASVAHGVIKTIIAVYVRRVKKAMHIVVHTSMLTPVALAAMHGTTDFAYPPYRLLPYMSILWWPELVPVTPVFLCASTVHFGRDVGGWNSGVMHGLFVLGAILGLEDEAFATFLFYFCVVHTPLHYQRHLAAWRYPLAATMLCALVLLCIRPLPQELVLTEWMQRLVIAHIVCDEWSLVANMNCFDKGE